VLLADDHVAVRRGFCRILSADPTLEICAEAADGEEAVARALASRPGVVKSRDALMDAAYDHQVYVDDRTIDSHIKRLRRKLKAVDGDFDMIDTLYGVGYRFKEA